LPAPQDYHLPGENELKSNNSEKDEDDYNKFKDQSK